MRPTLRHSNHSPDLFVKHWVADEKVEELLREKRLNFGQLGFFYALVQQMNTRSGLITITTKAMSERVGLDYGVAKRWLAKLLELRLVVRWRDPKQGTTHLVIHPYIASVGSTATQGLQWRRYCEGLEGREPPIPVPDELP